MRGCSVGHGGMRAITRRLWHGPRPPWRPWLGQRPFVCRGEKKVAGTLGYLRTDSSRVATRLDATAEPFPFEARDRLFDLD